MISKQQIKHLRSLHQKKFRDENKSYIAEGIRIINEALENAPELLKTIIYTSHSKQSLNLNALDSNCQLLEVSVKEFNQISAQHSPQEVMAVIKMPKLQFPDSNRMGDLTLILEKIRDPGNLGTMIRLADWYGVRQLICSKDSVDCYNPKVVQSSMGAIFRVEVHYIDLFEYMLDIKQSKSRTIYGTSLTGSDLFKTKLSKPAIIILGNESEGISKAIDELSDDNLYIPNFSSGKKTSESLNVSVAAAVVCSEFRRQTS